LCGPHAALTRKQKEEKVREGLEWLRSSGCLLGRGVSELTWGSQIDAIREQLEGRFFIGTFNYQGFTNKDMERLRGQLPEETDVMIGKNALIGLAVDGTEFEPLRDVLTGPNALVMTGEEVSPAVKKVNEFARTKRSQGYSWVQFTGGVMEGKLLGPEETINLERLPTKDELYAQIAIGVKAVPTKLAVGLKQVPNRVAYGVKEISEGESPLVSQ